MTVGILDPERMFRSLVGAMGLQPEQIIGFVNEVITELRTIRAEREAFKAACRATVPDIVARLERLEKAVWEIHQSVTGIPRPLLESETHVEHSGNGRERDQPDGT
jgi:hypothetical protein